MQPNVILKQPGKAVFYLFTIMILLIAKDSFGLGYCNKPCFGPVTKVKIYNHQSSGYLHVEGNNVRCNGPDNMAIYKISSGDNFYLYDLHARRFICWNRLRRQMRHHKKTWVGRKYRPKLMEYCKFIDMPAANAYVNLVSTFNGTNHTNHSKKKMMFNADGIPTNKHSNNPKREQFIMQVVWNSEPSNPCGCPEAKQHFCKTPLRKMNEFNDICNKHYRI